MYGGVTYRRTIAPKLSRNEGVSKEIDFREKKQQKLMFERDGRCSSGERKRERGRGVSGGPGGPHHAWACPGLGRAFPR